MNDNLYEEKEDVYLDGGPGPNAPISAAGLPAGDYYFQVTDPSGKDLLSSDHISCRRFHVDDNGVIIEVYAGTNYMWKAGAWVSSACMHATGVDEDHGDQGAITVQLFPYDDTPNKGGVYKVWITPVDYYTGQVDYVPTLAKDLVNGENYQPGDFHGFVPAHSKTDNFKVRRPGPLKPPSELVVRKFHDANMNGVFDTGEQEIVGWTGEVIDPIGASNNWFTPAEIVASAGTWMTIEATPSGTEITSASLDGKLLSLYPTANPKVNISFASDTEERHEVLYGNVGLGEIEACKVYDADADGVADEDEQSVSGWEICLSGTDVLGAAVSDCKTTGEDGCVTFADLLPGEYTVSEADDVPGWYTNGSTSYSVSIASMLSGATLSGSFEKRSFANFCTGEADFGTKGYWHNKNGLAEITPDDVMYVNTLLPYSAPSTYFGAGDEPFDGMFDDGTPVAASMGELGDELAPAGSTLAEISAFLVDANAGGDPREQLAQQLLAFIFNALHRIGGIDASIELPDGTFVAASELIAEAIEIWTNGSASEQTAIASLLDMFNNDPAVTYVAGSPCAIE